jgi:hypothetical protein
MTIQSLRDYGAVATTPDAPAQERRGLTAQEREMADAIIGLTLNAFDDSQNVDQLKTMLNKAPTENQAQEQKTIDTIVDKLIEELNKSTLSDEIKTLLLKRLLEYPRHAATRSKVFTAMSMNTASARISDKPAPTYKPHTGGTGSPEDENREPRDPFSSQPRVTVVPVSSTESSDSYVDGESPWSARSKPELDRLFDSKNDRDATKHGRVWTYYFDHPARFPTIKFGSNQCAFEGEGAVIHEGMRLLARQDGKYELRFNMTAPSIPVSLRLQLVLYLAGSVPGQPIPRTLTLPPIVLQRSGEKAFPNDLEGGLHPTTYLVSVLGYSQVVKEAQSDKKSPGYILLVKRNGTARMGSGVQYQATPQ